MIDFAIFGCGETFERDHAPAIETLKERARLVALADPSPERRDRVGERFGIHVKSRFASMCELLARTRLDLVYIVASGRDYAPAIGEAARGVVHIVANEPEALEPGEAQAILKAIDENIVRFAVIPKDKARESFESFIAYLEEGLGEYPDGRIALAK
jgi:UDP-N-acetyl-2-amino-2-deoxyglucuronate dehydrogenase